MDKLQEPYVSICCLTYNHEKYIRDAIESFLMQKTEFPFEIIVHDDASTDMTPNIIREYEEKYPEIIKPIYQTENQYSKGTGVLLLAILNKIKSKGKYLAFCEGDDYWTDPFKLQKQIIEMEKHPECHICFHPAVIKWNCGVQEDQILSLHSYESKIFTIEEVILGGGEFMPTNSIVINKLVIPRLTSFFDTFKDIPVGDYYIQILGAENGGALYLTDIMSVYRMGVSNSWTERSQKSSKSNNLWVNLLIIGNDEINAFTNYKYSKQFTIMNNHLVLRKLRSEDIDVDVRKLLFESYNKYIGFKDKLLWHTIFKHPQRTKIWLRLFNF